MTHRIVSLCGLFAMIGLAWLLSSRRGRVSLRVIVGGLVLQFGFALLVLRTGFGRRLFQAAGDLFTRLLEYVTQASMFVFGVDEPNRGLLLQSFAFSVLPTIIFFSALMSLLYHLGVMQRLVRLMARLMQWTLGTSGAESLSAASNIFVGMTEAPLFIRPYLASMTNSELNAVMVGGFATVAGGVMAAYVSFGIDAGHLLTASVISAPAGLLIAKIMLPEIDEPQTSGKAAVELPSTVTNTIEAVVVGAADGLKLAMNVGAMLIAFLALIAMLNALLGWVGGWFGAAWSIDVALGYLFWPFAWLMGVDANECGEVGRLLGLRMATNEFLAYRDLAELMQQGKLSERSAIITTYALCGFANFGSIGITVGGIGAIAPERQRDLARLGLRAMIGGTLACFMTACVAGVLIP
ncbi:MAG: NupC/NupG family nucleoside CNT transporter [Planctomycetes bacterium]|nr:NupC/NupG family nucleoside CNT transporter [Planctomycetota bacterium]